MRSASAVLLVCVLVGQGLSGGAGTAGPGPDPDTECAPGPPAGSPSMTDTGGCAAPESNTAFSILVYKAAMVDAIDFGTAADYYYMLHVWDGAQWAQHVSGYWSDQDYPVFNRTHSFTTSWSEVHFTISLLDYDPLDPDDVADIGPLAQGSEPSYDNAGTNVYYQNASFYGIYDPATCSLRGDPFTVDGLYYKTSGDGASVNDAALWFAVGPPCVTAVEPTGSGVSGYANINITFSTAMDWASVANAFTLSPPAAFRSDHLGKTFSVFPNGHWSFGTAYTARVSSSAVDFAGLPLASDYSWTFTVEPNTAPVAVAGPAQTTRIFEAVYFDGSGSYDLTGDIDNYTWDFGDGSPPGYGVAPPHAYQRLGTFAVRLTVLDDSGLSSSNLTTAAVVITNYVPKDISYDIRYFDDSIKKNISATVMSHEAVGKDLLVDLAKLKLPKWAWLFDKVYAYVSRFERSFDYSVSNVADKDGIQWSKYAGRTSWSIQRYHEPSLGYPVRIDWEVTDVFDGVESGGGKMKYTLFYKLVLLRQPVQVGLSETPQQEKRFDLSHVAAIFGTLTCSSTGTANCPGSSAKSVAAAGAKLFPLFNREYRITPLGRGLIQVGPDLLPAYKLREVSEDWQLWYSASGSALTFDLRTVSEWRDSTRWYDDKQQRSFFKIVDNTLPSDVNGDPDFSKPKFAFSYEALGFRTRTLLRDGVNQDSVNTSYENVVSMPIIGKTVAVTQNSTHAFMVGATLVMEVTITQTGTGSFTHTVTPAGAGRVIDTMLAGSMEEVTIEVQPFIDLRIFTMRKATMQVEREWIYMRLPVPTWADADKDGSYWDMNMNNNHDSWEPFLWDRPVVIGSFLFKDRMGDIVVPTNLSAVTVAQINVLKLIGWLAKNTFPALALAVDVIDVFFDVTLDFDLDFSTRFYYLTGFYMQVTNGTFENGDTVKLVWFGFVSPSGSGAVRNATTTLTGQAGAKVSLLAHRFVQAWAYASMSASLHLRIAFHWWIFYHLIADITLWKSGKLIEGQSRVYAPTPDYADHSFTADASAPTVSIASPADGSVTNKPSLTLSGSSSDNIAVSLVRVRMSGSAWQNCSPPVNPWSCTVPLSPGQNRIEAQAVDSSGNPSPLAAVSVALDTAPPSVTIATPADGSAVNSGTLRVSGTSSDNLGLATVEARVGAGSWQACAPPMDAWTCTVPLADGSNQVEVRAVDRAGNPSAVAAVSVILDKSPPLLKVEPPPGLVNRSGLTISGSASDNVRLGGVEMSVSGGDWTPCVLSGASWTCAAVLSEGANAVEVRALDSAGNTATASATVILDTVAPAISHAPPSARPGEDLVVSADITDANGVASATLVLRAGDGWTRSPMTGSGGSTFSATVKGKEIAEPTIEYYIEAVDRAGNAATNPAAGARVPHIVAVVPTPANWGNPGLALGVFAALAAALGLAGLLVAVRRGKKGRKPGHRSQVPKRRHTETKKRPVAAAAPAAAQARQEPSRGSDRWLVENLRAQKKTPKTLKTPSKTSSKTPPASADQWLTDNLRSRKEARKSGGSSSDATDPALPSGEERSLDWLAPARSQRGEEKKD